MASKHIRVPEPVYDEAVKVKEEHDFPTLGEAIRHMVREGRDRTDA